MRRLRIGRDTPVHVDIEDAVAPVLRHQPYRARRRADERVLISVAGRDAGDDEPSAAGDDLDPFDRSFRVRILPAPQVVPGGSASGVLHQASPGLAPAARQTRQVAVAGVGDGEERQTTPYRWHHLDLEPLPDERGDGHTAGQVKCILRNGLPDGVTGRRARLEKPVRDDNPLRQPADLDRSRRTGLQETPLRGRRLRPDQERQAAHVHPPERNVARLSAKNVHTPIACSRQVYWLVARHASDRRARSLPGHSQFSARPEATMHSSRAPPPTWAARRSYRRAMRTSSPSTAACPATPRRGCQLARPHRGRTPLRPSAQSHGNRAHATLEFPGKRPGLRITGCSARRKTALPRNSDHS